MHRIKIVPSTCAAFWLIVAGRAFGQQCDPSLLFKTDPVELIRGKDVAGQEGIYADHFRYRYQFANEENKAEFLKNPAKYEIQLGGSCARMGTLGGPGSTGIYALHEGRLYIFASEKCRKTFLGAPQKFLETDDPVPPATPESSRKGRELLEKAVQAMGGANRIDAIQRYAQRIETEETHNRKPVPVSETLILEFPDKVRQNHTWGDSAYSFGASGDAGWYSYSKDGYPLHAQQLAALRRQTIGRNLIAILQSRNKPGAVVARQESREVDVGGKKVSVEIVAIAYGGATNMLGIDPADGQVVTHSFRGPGPMLELGTVEKTYSNYTAEKEVVLPMSAAVTFDGQPTKDSPTHLKYIRLDEPADPSLFAPPVR